MKKIIFTIVAFAMMVLSGTAHAVLIQPELIFIQFGNSNPQVETGGAMYDTNQSDKYFWNSFQEKSGIVQLFNTNQQLTNATINWSAHSNNDGATAAFSSGSWGYDLMKGQLSTGNGNSVGTINFTNLAQGKYDLYVYSQDQPGQQQSLTYNITGSDVIQVPLSPNPDLNTFVSGSNFFKQEVRVKPDGSLEITFAASAPGGNNRGIINGLQLVQQATPTPEPASMVLFGFGGLLALTRRLKKFFAASV
jgi:hypothetical protein